MKRRYTTFFPVNLVPGGESTGLTFIITQQTFTGTDWPRVRCNVCDLMVPFVDMLGLSVEKLASGGVGLVLRRYAECCRCVPRRTVWLELPPGRLPVRLETSRLDDDSPIRWFDEKKRRWLSARNLQFRIMDKAARPLELRCQPYRDRTRAKDGRKYGR